MVWAAIYSRRILWQMRAISAGCTTVCKTTRAKGKCGCQIQLTNSLKSEKIIQSFIPWIGVVWKVNQVF